MTKKNIIIIISILIGVLVISLVINALIPRSTLTFAVAPEEVTVSINGKEQDVKNGDSITVSPGDITLIISRNEFNSYTEDFTIKNGETKELLVVLEALTDNARALLLTPGSQEVIQRYGGKKVQDGAKALNKKYPILSVLPIKDRFYNIVPCASETYPGDTSKIAVCIKLFNLEAQQSALDDITRRGYQLTDYEIIIKDSTYSNLQEQSGE